MTHASGTSYVSELQPFWLIKETAHMERKVHEHKTLKVEYVYTTDRVTHPWR